jgi:hypothetical protein
VCNKSFTGATIAKAENMVENHIEIVHRSDPVDPPTLDEALQNARDELGEW